MRHLVFALIILSLLISPDSFSQSNIQIGASGVFSKTKGAGLEVTGNAVIAKNFSIGLGARPFKFEDHSNLYIPVFSTLKYYYPLSRSRLFASLDPGYGIYPSENLPEWSLDYRRNGALYLSGGVGIMGNSKLAPYASVHFTKFGFTEHYGGFSQYRPISTFTFTAGIMLNKWLPDNGVVRTKETKQVLPGDYDYYSRKSVRQKRTGWILLGSGMALIATGILVASQEKDDAIKAAVPLVLISGAGVATSLASIPFFVFSGHNRRKATH